MQSWSRASNEVVEQERDVESELLRRREEERRQRLEMGRTVNLDQHREDLAILDSNNDLA